MKYIVILFLALISLCSSIDTFAQEYRISDVGTLLTDTSTALSINDKGQVAGICAIDGRDHLFLWDSKTNIKIIEVPLEDLVEDIPVPQDEKYIGIEFKKSVRIDEFNIFKLTDKGTIFFSISIHYLFGCCQNVTQQLPMMWNQESGLVKIEVELAKNVSITSVNNNDELLLTLQDENKKYYSVIYKNNTIKFLDNVTYATSINNNGLILGALKINNESKTVTTMCLLDKKNNIIMRDIKKSSSVFNDNYDFIIHNHLSGRECSYDIYNIKTNQTVNIGIFPHNITRSKINNKREVLLNRTNQPLLFTKSRKLIDLQKNLNLGADISTKWISIYECYDLNNSGKIVGKGIYNGKMHAFILTPIKK